MSCLVFAGPDSGGIKEEVERVRNDYAKKAGETPEVQQYYIGQDDVQNILANLRNVSLFSNYIFAIIHKSDSINAADLKLIKEYWKHPNEKVLAVFCSDETKTITDKFSWAPKQACKAFYELDEGGKRAEIRKNLGSSGAKIDDDAIELLAELVSGDRADIKSQCFMLLTMHGNIGHIRLDEVETFIFHSREESIYSLFEYIADADFALALESLHTILISQSIEPVGIVLGLQWQFRSMLHLKQTCNGTPSWEDFKAVRVMMKRTQAVYTRALRNYDDQRIQGMVTTLARHDFLVREARPGTHRLILECMIYELIQNRTIPDQFTESRGFFSI